MSTDAPDSTPPPAGADVVGWLYHDQLKVDDEWAVRSDRGFTWWPDRHAQTVEVVGAREGPDGESSALVSVRTDLVVGVELTDQTLGHLAERALPRGSMSGHVCDEAEGRLSLCSLVAVHEGNADWLRVLLSVAAVLQIDEARFQGPALAEALGVPEAAGGHPERGPRPEPDEIADVADLLVRPHGEGPSRWSPAEFEGLVGAFGDRPPSLAATSGAAGVTVEFPFGSDNSSLFRLDIGEPHARYGSGLFAYQSFRAPDLTEAEGARLALDLNRREQTAGPGGPPYGLGGYTYARGAVHHAGFIPNLVYRPGLLVNLYLGAAARARAVDSWLTGESWTEASFDPERTAVARYARSGGAPPSYLSGDA